MPVFGDGGEILHKRGVTESPGLYFLGLSWQYTRGSALLGWVKDDAEYIAEQISASRTAVQAQALQPEFARGQGRRSNEYEFRPLSDRRRGSS